jgi:homogentisate phytyltransferase/homogentisate geranylgeranyltransferase
MLNKIIHTLNILWRFSRPHTVIGTFVSVSGLYVIFLSETGFERFDFFIYFWTVFSCLAGNIYIVGLNQLQDVEIDKINKSYLPLAAGDLSMKQGRMIVFACLAIAIVVSIAQGIFLFLVVLISVFLGTIYSLPPVRLKQYPFWAAVCIITVRGVIVNLGIYLHYRWAITNHITIPAKIWALTLFMFGFSLIIAWFKDIPDTEGDRIFRIMTYALKVGRKAIFISGTTVLSICYISLVLAGVWGLPGMNGFMLATTHAFLLGLLIFKSLKTDPEKHTAMVRQYHFIWILFYLEYLVYPAAAVFGSIS